MNKNTASFCSEIRNHNIPICSLSKERQKDATHCVSGPAEYKCGTCGAHSNHTGNICDPVQMPEIGAFGDGADNLNLEGHCR